MTDLLRLRAEGPDDLPALSALVQDMAVKPADIGWDRPGRRLVLLGNRYRWEAGTATRARAALRFDHVRSVARRLWPADRDAVLALLAVRAEDTVLWLGFSGGAELRVDAEVIDVTLEDLAGPWGALGVPDHDAGWTA